MSPESTIDNAQSHVTAFRPISEAARSWSDDNMYYGMIVGDDDGRCAFSALTLCGRKGIRPVKN